MTEAIQSMLIDFANFNQTGAVVLVLIIFSWLTRSIRRNIADLSEQMSELAKQQREGELFDQLSDKLQQEQEELKRVK